MIFDPFLGVRNIICFAPGKLCFPLREIDFVTENSLPARGWKTPPKSSFFTGATVARPEFPTAGGFSPASLKTRSKCGRNSIIQHSKTGLYKHKKGDGSVESSPQTGPIRHAFLPKKVLKPERYPGIRTRFSTRVRSNPNLNSDKKDKGCGYKKGRFPGRKSTLFELQLSEFSIFRNGQMAFRIYLKSYGENRFNRN